MTEQTKNSVTEVTDEQLAQLIAKNSELQKQEMMDGGVQPDYIILAKNNTQALDPTNADLYIPNLQIGDFFVQKEKVNLGRELKVVPLMFLTVYNEKEHSGRDARLLGKWSYEQGSQFPLCEGSYFDRQLPNGHILQPSNWVVVEVSGHPEFKFAVIPYKSTGSRIWKQWKEDVRKRSGASATLIYKVRASGFENAKGKWLDIVFEYAGSLLEASKTMAVKCLEKSNELCDLYSKKMLFEPHNIDDVAALPSPKAQDVAPAIPEKVAKPADDWGSATVETDSENVANSNFPSDDDLDDIGF